VGHATGAVRVEVRNINNRENQVAALHVLLTLWLSSISFAMQKALQTSASLKPTGCLAYEAKPKRER